MKTQLLLVAIALLVTLGPLQAEEALPLEAEAPVAIGSLPARTGLSLASGLDAKGLRPARYGANLALGDWRLGLAGNGVEAAPRGALAADLGRWRLVAGGVGGDWGQGLLLGARRRGSLGNPRAARSAALPLTPSTASNPLGRGLLLLGGSGRASAALALLLDDADSARPWARRALSTALGLRWRGLSLDLLEQPGARGLALGTFGERADRRLACALEAGLLAPAAAPLRRGLAWRLDLAAPDPATGLRLGVEGLLLAGPQPDVARGWFSAAPGEDLHAALAGPGPGPWRWRLARRLRRGLGLASGTRRSESALLVEGEGRLAPILVELEVRQVEERRREEAPGMPGFPRSEEAFVLRQELALGLAGARGPALCWRRRLGESGVGSLVQLTGALPGVPRLRLSLLRHELEPGAPSFLVYTSGEAAGGFAADSETRALAGRGWQASAQLRLGGSGRRGTLSARYGRCDDGSATWSLVAGVELARTRAGD
jgi:hypothetical protein